MSQVLTDATLVRPKVKYHIQEIYHIAEMYDPTASSSNDFRHKIRACLGPDSNGQRCYGGRLITYHGKAIYSFD